MSNLCIIQENLFSRLSPFSWFLIVYFCKNSIFECIKILSLFKMAEIRYQKFSLQKKKNFVGIKFRGQVILNISSNHFFIYLVRIRKIGENDSLKVYRVFNIFQ